MTDTLRTDLANLLEEHGLAFWETVLPVLEHGVCPCGRPLSVEDGRHHCRHCDLDVVEPQHFIRKGRQVRLVGESERVERTILDLVKKYPDIKERVIETIAEGVAV